MTNENRPERYFSREEIFSELRARCENFRVERELTDTEGIYLLEILTTDGTKRYSYQRKRLLPGEPQGIESSGTTIRVEWLDDDYAKTLAVYDYAKDEWVDQ